ncbi:Mitochondrial import inner membrane translocase subunit tim22 [Quaeritorhiza haematococci]|nr:Mitochondrial import inner membrane translocase subunit tim22 [Quaeritorhiza haematococci]
MNPNNQSGQAPSPFPFGPVSPDQVAAMALMESCPAKTVMSAGAGFVFGGVFGTFMSSIDWNVNHDEYQKMTTKQQLRYTLKDMGQKSYSTAKNFAIVGAMFAGTECIIETYRAKNDMYNGISAGCITGGALAARAGPQAMVYGCAGFAAFSAAIDYWFRHHS